MGGRLWVTWLVRHLLAGGIFAVGTIAHSATAAAPAEDLSEACKTCHAAQYDTFKAHRHGNKGDARTPANAGACSACHGDGIAHIKAGGGRGVGGIINPASKSLPAEARSQICLNCHESGKRVHWAGSQHASRGVTCTNCHSMHVPQDNVLVKLTQPDVCYVCHKEQRAQGFRISRHPIREGKVACSDCHNPHGSTGPKLLVKNSVNETCYTCHAEKRGPFLWEHSAVVDDCTNCHTPHGSTTTPLLKARAPWLCQECHSGDHARQINSGADLIGGNATTFNGRQAPASLNPRSQLAARACLNCHVQIHGSNHPAGAKFQR